MHWQKSVKKHKREEVCVVIDTNVFISYLWGSRNTETIAELLFTGKIRSMVSDAMLEELSTVGKRGKFKGRFSEEILADLCNAYRDISIAVQPRKRMSILADTKDNIFIECAVEAEADYLTRLFIRFYSFVPFLWEKGIEGMRSNVHIKLFALTSPQPLSHRRGAKKIILQNL